MVWVEAAFALYSAVVLVLALLTHNAGAILLPLLGVLGFGYVALRAWRESRATA